MDVHVHLARYFGICKHMDVQSSSLSATAKRYAEQVAAGEILACRGVQRARQPLAGELIQLEPWQAFILTTVFGWVREDGQRRFRRS